MLLRIVIGILGFLFVIFGMALILKNWDLLSHVIIVIVGPVIAVGGLVMMFYASIKPSQIK